MANFIKFFKNFLYEKPSPSLIKIAAKTTSVKTLKNDRKIAPVKVVKNDKKVIPVKLLKNDKKESAAEIKTKEKIPVKFLVEKSALKAANKIKRVAITKVKLKQKLAKKLKKSEGSEILKKAEQNPIISPKQENSWEAWQTFNPGAVLIDEKVHFIYRAVGGDGISRLGYAVSSDGFSIDERLPYPVYEYGTGAPAFNVYSYFSGGSWGGAEDPRLVRMNDEDVLYMTYTACADGLRVGLTSIKVDDFLNKKWNWKLPVLISPPDEVHKNWLLFPEKINGRYAILHSLKPHIQIEYFDNLEFDGTKNIKSIYGGSERKNGWDKWIRGAGAPPIKTKEGWLLFYHAMDNDWSKYKVGVMLLDLNDPTKILYRAKKPVLEPAEDYENNGFKSGVIYVSGVVVKDEDLLVYYGSSDSHVCVASANLNNFLEALKQHKEPKLNLKKLKIA